MISIALALTSALSWGTGDFLGGLAARRFDLAWVLCGTALGGLALGTAVSLASGDDFLGGEEIALSLAAGVAGLIGLACFYHALAIGTMSIVAPISASGAAVPVLWGVANGEQLSTLAVASIVLVIAGVMLASRAAPTSEAEAGESHALSVLLALIAAASFGAVFTLIAETADASVYWPSAVLKAATFVGAAAFVLVRLAARGESGERPRGRQWFFPLSIGCFDVSANVAFSAATTHGQLAITAVVSSLYPVTTVLLAYLFLHERLTRSQCMGVVLAMVGVCALAAL